MSVYGVVDKDKRAWVRVDLLNKGLAVPVGDDCFYGAAKPLYYRWVDFDTFEVFYNGRWLSAESIDWDFTNKVVTERLLITSMPVYSPPTTGNDVRVEEARQSKGDVVEGHEKDKALCDIAARQREAAGKMDAEIKGKKKNPYVSDAMCEICFSRGCGEESLNLICDKCQKALPDLLKSTGSLAPLRELFQSYQDANQEAIDSDEPINDGEWLDKFIEEADKLLR